MSGVVRSGVSGLRYPLAIGLALAVTIALFFGMQLLIAEVEGELKERKRSMPIEMVRIKREIAPVVKPREMPQKPESAPEPPPPAMEMSDPSAPSDAAAIPIAVPTPSASMALRSGPRISSASVDDAAATPLVRVAPRMPHEARMQGVEGLVIVRFDIGATGAVSNVEVIHVKPVGYGFEKAAVTAVKRWKYRPKVVDGEVTIQKGVQTAIKFTIEKKQ